MSKDKDLTIAYNIRKKSKSGYKSDDKDGSQIAGSIIDAIMQKRMKKHQLKEEQDNPMNTDDMFFPYDEADDELSVSDNDEQKMKQERIKKALMKKKK